MSSSYNPLLDVKALTWNKSNQFFFKIEPVLKKPKLPLNDMEMMAALISVEIPDVTNENFEEYYSGKYYYAMGRNSIYQLTATYRDPYPSVLYNYFNTYLIMTRKKYPDDIKWKLKLQSTLPGKEKKDILEVHDAMLVGLSNLTFDQSLDQILEFSVSWKFTLFNNEGLLI